MESDLGGIPSRTIVLTPHSIRAVARISLAYKRLDQLTDTFDDDRTSRRPSTRPAC